MIFGTIRRFASVSIATAALGCFVLALPGCVPLVIGGIAGTAVVATDRRTTGAQLDDELIEDKTTSALLERFRGREVHVNVTSYNGIVLLSGEAPSETVKSEIEGVARGMPKVRYIQNEMVVGPAADFGSRSNDTFITSKVKTRFVEGNKFQINYVKVVTERSIVYLLGIVRPEEGNAAAEIARTTSGVQRVVKVFEYIN
jgi:osmotically-inducible protein OsmY